MWLLQTQGDEEGFVSIGLVFQPFDDLSGVLAVLVLGVGETTASATGRSLGIELAGNLPFECLPFSLVGVFIDRAVLGLEFLTGFPNHSEFVVVEAEGFVPRDVSVVTFSIVENLAHAGRPVSVLHEEPGH